MGIDGKKRADGELASHRMSRSSKRGGCLDGCLKLSPSSVHRGKGRVAGTMARTKFPKFENKHEAKWRQCWWEKGKKGDCGGVVQCMAWHGSGHGGAARRYEISGPQAADCTDRISHLSRWGPKSSVANSSVALRGCADVDDSEDTARGTGESWRLRVFNTDNDNSTCPYLPLGVVENRRNAVLR
ncbi:hypothetical protein K458DRAFT_7584 [Lentithecium fluviatile CBS 122367]|uniref:Uncharacterized protein n=1 Tax=Lentithecium fluviatile CBS 122367 TaxID=1168545 RepID=A0A6G1JP32_9PLEO|nr:hypothetical protein K458DRAFT_7584 [Lentithecium fluviatile CBS 122367]